MRRKPSSTGPSRPPSLRAQLEGERRERPEATRVLLDDALELGARQLHRLRRRVGDHRHEGGGVREHRGRAEPEPGSADAGDRLALGTESDEAAYPARQDEAPLARPLALALDRIAAPEGADRRSTHDGVPKRGREGAEPGAALQDALDDCGGMCVHVTLVFVRWSKWRQLRATVRAGCPHRVRLRHAGARSSPFGTFERPASHATTPMSFVALALVLVALRLRSRAATALIALSPTEPEPEAPASGGAAFLGRRAVGGLTRRPEHSRRCRAAAPSVGERSGGRATGRAAAHAARAGRGGRRRRGSASRADPARAPTTRPMRAGGPGRTPRSAGSRPRSALRPATSAAAGSGAAATCRSSTRDRAATAPARPAARRRPARTRSPRARRGGCAAVRPARAPAARRGSGSAAPR